MNALANNVIQNSQQLRKVSMITSSSLFTGTQIETIIQNTYDYALDSIELLDTGYSEMTQTGVYLSANILATAPNLTDLHS